MTDKELNEAVARKLGLYRTYVGTKKGWTHPDYCHDIAAAWEIVEKVDYCYLFKCDGMFEWKWECKLTRREEDRKWYATADTAPKAICLAFLKVGE